MKKNNLYMVLIAIIITIISCILSFFIPISIFSTAIHDDAHFINQSISIINGDWLGTYNQMTLIKGPAFPIWLIIAHYTHVPLSIFNQLIYCISSIALTFTIKKFVGGKNFPYLILIALLCFQPYLFTERVIRDYSYTSLTFLLIASIANISGEMNVKNIFCILLSSVFSFMFWYTREEGIWIVLFLIIPVILIKTSKNKLGQSLSYITCIILFFLFSSLISHKNMEVYGTASIVDFKDTSFKNALAALYSIKPTQTKPDHVPASKDQRLIAYKISPTFKKLEPFLESNNGWKAISCNVYSNVCGDYAGGWFMWAFRDAVYNVGGYKNAVTSNNFYSSIANEINTACEKKIISCNKSLISYLPSPPPDFIIKYVKAMLKGLLKVTYIDIDTVSPRLSYDGGKYSIKEIADFFNITNYMPTDEQLTGIISGWYYNHNDNEDWLFLKYKGNKIIKVRRELSIDVSQNLNTTKASNVRFRIPDVSELEAICSLHNTDSCVHFANIKQNRQYALAGGVLNIDKIIIPNKINPSNKYHANTLKLLTILYKIITLVLTIYSVVIVNSTLRSKKSTFNIPALIIVITSLGLCFSRIAILALIDITAFPAIVPLYMLPCYPLYCVSIFTATFLLKRNKKESD